MLEHFRRERMVRKALRAVARQRVILVLKPGNVHVIENSPTNEEWFEVGIRTCHIRGWVEVLHENLPTGSIQMHGRTPQLPGEMPAQTHYRLTEGGWAVLHSSHGWVVATFIISAVGLAVGVASLAVAWVGLPTAK
jgi:hypothetical protein